MNSRLIKGIHAIPFFFFLLALSFSASAGPQNHVTPRLEHNRISQTPAAMDSSLSRRVSFDLVKASADLKDASAPGLATPDFAYPQTVSADARKIYARAIARKQPVTALRAAMQLSVASTLVSRDSVGEDIARFQQLATELPAPYSSLARLLEGRMLAEMYAANRYTYDRRTLPDEEPSADPTLWSGLQFRKRINQLLTEALRTKNELIDTPIEAVAPLVESAETYSDIGMSLYDFAIYQSISILDLMGADYNDASDTKAPIPFILPESPGNAQVKPVNEETVADHSTSAQQLTRLNLINMLIDSYPDSTPAGSDAARRLMMARLKRLQILPTDSRQDYARQLIDIYPLDHPLHPEVLVFTLYQGCENSDEVEANRRKYNMIQAALKRYPDSPAAGCLRDMLSVITNPTMNVKIPSQLMTEPVDAVDYTLSNINEAHILLVPVSRTFSSGSYDQRKVRNLPKTSLPISLGIASCSDSIPFKRSGKLALPSLKPGFYAVVASASDKMEDIFASMLDDAADVICVADITTFTTAVDEKNTRIFVIDAATGAPVKGARIHAGNSNRSSKTPRQTDVTTGADGSAIIPFNNFECTVSSGDNVINRTVYNYYYSPHHEATVMSATILTDLALFHPGDKVEFAVVLCQRDSLNRLSMVPDCNLRVDLLDANRQVCDSCLLTTDRLSRANASLQIPADGLTGSFTLQASLADSSENASQKYIGYASIEVADYKAPTFYVKIDEPQMQGAELNLSGSVNTYSGMPLANQDVTISIKYNPVWWWWRSAPATELADEFSHTVATDASGRFSLPLGLEKVIADGYDGGWFSISARSTSESGESVESNPRRFSVGEGFQLSASDQTIKADSDTIVIKVNVEDILGQNVSKEISYTLTDSKGKSVAAGSFSSPLLALKSANLPSDTYQLRATLAEGRKEYLPSGEAQWIPDSVSSRIIIWRDSDRTPPEETALWVPQSTYYASADADSSIPVTFGSSFPSSRIFYQISDREKVVKEGWIKASAQNVSLSCKVPRTGDRMRINLFANHNLQQITKQIEVRPASELTKLNIKTISFRDRITPGSQESWRFIVSLDDTPSAYTPSLAVLSDAALNAITPFSWDMYLKRLLSYSFAGRINQTSPNTEYISASPVIRSGNGASQCALPFSPEWNLWGYDLFGSPMRSRMVFASTSRKMTTGAVPGVMVANEVSYKSAAEDSVMLEESAVESAEDEDGADAGNNGSADSSADMPQLRPSSMPLALFRPDLTTDAEGNLDITFTVPDFNTTWALQLLAYDKDMNVAKSSLETTASKSIMVSTLMPRFLLTGDKATVSATVFNNSDHPVAAPATIEIFNPADGKVIASSKVADGLALEAMANGVVSVCFDVPDEVTALGVRSVASADGNSDGEQDLFPVLPSSQPVMESTTFYLTPSDLDLSVRLPHMDKDDKVTLNYCANPAWYVLTSLSGLINSDSESTLSLLNSLYANSVSTGLLKRYPQVREALKSLYAGSEADSLLTSPLEKNESLKIAALNSTPWVNNAKSESERMQGLQSLLSESEADKAINDIIDRLDKNRMADGGWCWMPKMESSLWISLNVVNAAAMMKDAGYMPESSKLKSMIADGLKYTDAKIAEDYRLTVDKYKTTYPLDTEISYFLTRSTLTDAALPAGLRAMHDDMVRRLPKEWRDMSIGAKAKAARMAMREGNATLAREILNSVREFASYKPDKGMWFDRLDNGFFSLPPMVTTALCITAFNEVLPGDEAIMKMCQYLVLSRQTEDWNLDMTPAAATATVNAVLGSDLGWNSDEAMSMPRIYLDDAELRLPQSAESLTGNLFLDLTPEMASGRVLRVVRNGKVPAWGGVLRQYVAPVMEVKAQSVPQLKITKSLLPIESTPAGEKALKASTHFKKGDRIRVTLTLEADRDMDYILIRDSRGGCMQPADQLTEYEVQNGLWILRETRTSATNLYLTRLPKGKFIITYDVFADRDGDYSTGIATAQSQYYPLITAHSAGCVVKVD